jgi:hypothetical protein
MEIERSIRSLSLEEQLWLPKRIARNLREQTQVAAESLDSADKSEQLAAMASDLDIQAELATINKEFAVTEMDGLETL